MRACYLNTDAFRPFCRPTFRTEWARPVVYVFLLGVALAVSGEAQNAARGNSNVAPGSLMFVGDFSYGNVNPDLARVIGVGPSVAQNVAPGAPPVSNRLTSPALPGQYITLWATGLGGLRTPDVTVQVGGKNIVPIYAGGAPGLPGLDQINFPVSSEIPDGCYVPVRIVTGDGVSNEVTIAKASFPGSCTHPLQLSESDLQALDRGGTLLAGTVRFHNDVFQLGGYLPDLGYNRVEEMFAAFWAHSAQDVFLLSQSLPADAQYFGCELTRDNVYTDPESVSCSSSDDYDAGPSLSITGRDGRTLEMPGPPSRFCRTYGNRLDDSITYDTMAQLPPPFLNQGDWTLVGPGGRTINAFRQSFTLPPVIRWTNRDSVRVLERDHDVPIAWEPEGYNATDSMVVTISTGGFPVPTSPGKVFGLVCRAPALAGMVTIPADLLRQIEPTSSPYPYPDNRILRLEIVPRPTNRVTFTLSSPGSTRAPAVIDYSVTQTGFVWIR
jgi:hypothetical protein